MIKKYNQNIYYILAFITALYYALNATTILASEISQSEIKASWIHTSANWFKFKNKARNKKITICTIGRDKVHFYLNKIRNKSKNLPFEVLNRSPDDDLKKCNILYISESEQEYYTNILQRIDKQKSVISISSIKGFAHRGGTIEFVIKKKARLIINLKTAKESNVIIDDDLIGWSQTIYQ